jgi:hypothetical protein
MVESRRIAAAGLVLGASLFFASFVEAWVPPCAIDGSCRIFGGRMTGGGSIFTGTADEGDFFVEPGTRVTHGFELHCDMAVKPNNLQVNIHRPNGDGATFHLDRVVASYCYDSPDIKSGKPAAPFDSIYGQGIGRYNGTAGYCADWEFTDAGEPGSDDQILNLRIWEPGSPGNCGTSNGPMIFSSTAGHALTYGNHQAHKDKKSAK